MRLFLLALVLLCSCGCSFLQKSSAAPRPGTVNHIALFMLQDPTNAEELMADCDELLSTIPNVESYFSGTHLDTGRGDHVDGNYDVAVYLGFDSAEDYEAYIKHPNHVKLVNKWQPLLEWLRVHDVIDDTP